MGTPTAWEKLGLTEADEPHTYAELYALAQKYFALEAETRRGTLFFDGMLNGQAGVLLLSSFIQQYAGEFADAEETSIMIPTPSATGSGRSRN